MLFYNLNKELQKHDIESQFSETVIRAPLLCALE